MNQFFKISILIAFVSVGMHASGQKIQRYYFNTHGAYADSAESYYYTESRYINDEWVNRSYFSKTGRLRSEEREDTTGRVTRILYHNIEGMAVKAEIILNDKGLPEQTTLLYPSGKKQAAWEYERASSSYNSKITQKIISYWDSIGRPLVIEGKGFCECILDAEDEQPYVEKGEVENSIRIGAWVGTQAGGRSFDESYVNGELVAGTFTDKDGTAYPYKEIQKYAEPMDGIQAFYRFISMNIRYPKPARRVGVEGKVFVEFVVERDGTLSNLRVLRGIGAGCDEEALRVMRTSLNWSPGRYRGKTVRQRFVLPLTFKLT